MPDEYIEYIENAAETGYVNTGSSSQMIEDEKKCPGISGASKLNLGSPLSFERRDGDDAAMEYDAGWLVSFSSGEHEKGNETDYEAHGSQYVPILFQWVRTDVHGLDVSHYFWPHF